jgi:hypothetical protein
VKTAGIITAEITKRQDEMDWILNIQEEVQGSLREILDKFGVEISDRFSQLWELESRFGFLCFLL